MCCESAIATVGIAVLPLKRGSEAGDSCTTHCTNTGQKPVPALMGWQGEEVIGEAGSVRMNMNLENFVNKPFNEKDTKHPYRKMIEFYSFPLVLERKQ